MSRSTTISRERPRKSNDRRADDSPELRREISALEESLRLLKRDHATCCRKLAQVEAEKAELVAAHAAEKAAMAEENRQLRELIVAQQQRIGELERSSNLSAATAASLRRATDSRNRLPTRNGRNASTACAASRSADPAASPDIGGLSNDTYFRRVRRHLSFPGNDGDPARLEIWISDHETPSMHIGIGIGRINLGTQPTGPFDTSGTSR